MSSIRSEKDPFDHLIHAPDQLRYL
jgi:hypothetical protein